MDADYGAAVIGQCADELKAILHSGFNYIENPHQFDQEKALQLADELCACRAGSGGLYQGMLDLMGPEDREANYGAFRAKGPHPSSVMDEWIREADRRMAERSTIKAKVSGSADIEVPPEAILFAASDPRRTPQRFSYPESFDAAQELAAIADLAESLRNRYVPGRRAREGVKTEEEVRREFQDSAEAVLKRIRESQEKEAKTRKRLETGKATTRPVPTTETFPFPKYRASVGYMTDAHPCGADLRDFIAAEHALGEIIEARKVIGTIGDPSGEVLSALELAERRLDIDILTERYLALRACVKDRGLPPPGADTRMYD